MPTNQFIPDTGLAKVAYLTFNVGQAAATYDVGTATGGDVMIEYVAIYNSVAGVGLVSCTIQTNHTTPVAILASTLLGALTGGVSLTPYTGKIILPSTKKIQGTVVGAGSSGTIRLAVRYFPLASGATLA